MKYYGMIKKKIKIIFKQINEHVGIHFKNYFLLKFLIRTL